MLNDHTGSLPSSVRDGRIEICGGIASGKTTLAALLTQANLKPVLEDFQANPFWEAFYSDPKKFSFETEIAFLLQHYHQIKALLQVPEFLACDYSFILDLAYARVDLTGSQLDVFLRVLAEVERDLPSLTLLVHLECDAEEEMRRIQKRGRLTETSIDLPFLHSINEEVRKVVAEKRDTLSVLTIDSARQDFAHDDRVKQSGLAKVSRDLREIQRD